MPPSRMEVGDVLREIENTRSRLVQLQDVANVVQERVAVINLFHSFRVCFQNDCRKKQAELALLNRHTSTLVPFVNNSSPKKISKHPNIKLLNSHGMSEATELSSIEQQGLALAAQRLRTVLLNQYDRKLGDKGCLK